MNADANRVNNFALLRLLLAVAVIVSHSPQLITGRPESDPAFALWGTVTLGGLAVDSFFLVSGYLIAASFQNSSSFWDFMRKRVLRIYPGFIAAFLACVFIVAPLAGGRALGALGLAREAAHVIFLAPPEVPGAFSNMPHPALNGSMWTISYEFRAYLLVGLLGAMGAFRFRYAVLSLAIVTIIVHGTRLLPGQPLPPAIAFGLLDVNVRLISFFLTGTSFYLFRDRIRYDGRIAAAALALLVLALFSRHFAEPAFAPLGGYALFWFAFKAPFQSVSSRIQDDISYGIYLYAWPAQSLILFWGWTQNEWLVTIAATLISATLGYASWKVIEQPALRMKSSPKRWKLKRPANATT